MFKITNGQAGAFNSPIIAKLFNDENRQFPITDAFRLADMIQSIQGRLEPYRATVKQVIDAHGGVVDEKGFVTYPSAEDVQAASDKINDLNAVEMEFPGEKISPVDGWPNLTLNEATILRPLLNGTEEKP